MMKRRLKEHKEFEVWDLGQLKYFLLTEIARCKDLDQLRYFLVHAARLHPKKYKEFIWTIAIRIYSADNMLS